jgi:PAS domain S-box-containing protein
MSAPAAPDPANAAPEASGPFRALVEAAPFGLHLYRLEPDGQLVFTGANPAADRILGIENAALRGRSIEEAFPALASTDIPDRYREVARTGVSWNAERVYYDDERITGAYEVHAFSTGPGQMAAAFHDITERKRAEQALAREKERLAVTVRSIGDAVITTDPAGHVTLMNGIAEALTGYSAAEAVGRPLAEVFRIVSERTRNRVEDPAAQVLREGKVVGLASDSVLVARDGTQRPIANSGAPIRGAGGELIGVVLVFRDQTAEREAEALLVESEARYRAVVRSVPVVQWAIDRAGVFTLSEGLGLAALGLKPGQVVGWNVAEVYHDNPSVLADFRRALAGETFASDIVVRGEVFESHWAPVRNDAGVIVGVTGIGLHVTAERALREQVARTQKLESLGRLAGGVAHDFNNLLTVILSCAELLREAAEEDQPANREDVEQIAAAGERARELVRQLLAFARKQVIAPEPTDLPAVLEAATPLLRRLLGEAVELRVQAEPGLWPVLGDPGQLEQVFLNLALNARDAMSGSGRLEIRIGNLTIADGTATPDGPPPGDWVQVAVADTGAGMSEEVKSHIFEPFFTTKAPGEGTGLGLALVYGVVSQSNGRIEVDSEPGVGSTFRLLFPRCELPVAPREDGLPAEGTAGGSETVLVVDDNALVRGVTTRTLRQAGYRVLSAGDAREGLAAALSLAGRVQLVITDVVMPGMSGTAFAEQLAQRLPNVRVLFVSGYSREATVGRGIGRTSPFLAKPFTASTLLARVREVLDAPRVSR